MNIYTTTLVFRSARLFRLMSPFEVFNKMFRTTSQIWPLAQVVVIPYAARAARLSLSPSLPPSLSLSLCVCMCVCVCVCFCACGTVGFLTEAGPSHVPEFHCQEEIWQYPNNVESHCDTTY